MIICGLARIRTAPDAPRLTETNTRIEKGNVMQAKDIMQHHVITTEADTSAHQVAHLLASCLVAMSLRRPSA
jgi:hypothetical protein